MMKRFFATLLTLAMCLSMTTPTTLMAGASEIPPTTVDNAEFTADEDGWTLLEVPTTADGSGIVPYGGVETWDYTGYTQRHVGDFTMEGYNLTPVKTIAQNDSMNRYLTIYTNFTCSSSSILTVQIRDYPSGTVLAQNKSGATTNGSVTVQASGVSGRRVQIYFRVTDANGNYSGSRSCNISYGYTLRGIG